MRIITVDYTDYTGVELNKKMDSWLVIVICIPISIICFVIFGKKAGQRMPSLRGKHVVITGGSRGIGFAIAMEVLEEGGYVTLISNSSSQIDDAISDIAQQGKYSLDKVCTKVADVGDYESISTAIKECYEWRPFDVVICNAGIARIGYMDEINITDVDSIIRTNLSGVVYTVHSSLPLMKQRSSKSNPAAIVLMGSLASMHPCYGYGIYTATKHALKGLAECLRFELLPFNIRVTICCPGFAKTPLLPEGRANLLAKTPLQQEAQKRNSQNLESIHAIMRVIDFYNMDKLEEPQDIARATVQGIKKGSFLVVTSPIALFLTYCNVFTELLTFLIAAGESSTPLQNVWTISRMAKTESALANMIYSSVSPFFTVYFTMVRCIVGPWLAWKLASFYLAGKADAVIPYWMASSWMVTVILALFGSTIWVYKLWTGLIRFYAKRGLRRASLEPRKE